MNEMKTGFPTYGVELEYMIVDRQSLNIQPLADKILLEMDPNYEDEVCVDGVAWSHELVRHVLEVKTDGPVATLDGQADRFAAAVRAMNGRLKPMGAMLLPTASHPWMSPFRECRLWERGSREIYESFDRIFGCKGHGWSNLQSVHLNLPFTDEDSMVRLHAAIRLVLPLIPAIAASSPVLDSQPGDYLDMRLEVYRHNCHKVPSISGQVIPEAITSKTDYEENIFQRIYRDMEPHDPEGILRHEWVNARGAIVRFDRKTIEIRLVDLQECPKADLAILSWLVAVIERLVTSDWETSALLEVDTEHLAQQFLWMVQYADQAELQPGRWGEILTGNEINGYISARQLILAVTRQVAPAGPWVSDFEAILRSGPLSRRILRALNEDYSRDKLQFVYGQFAECLEANEIYEN
jgi:gamma-glutamyl:cysteine ligase YbdK (ATP-grasp superfamily)